MNAIKFDFSLKNIPLSNRLEYHRLLVARCEQFIRQLRWKTFYFRKDTARKEKKEKFGFKSNRTPPPDEELAAFENDLWDLVKNLKYRNNTSKFQQELRETVEKIKNNPNLIIPADKTDNFYEVSVEKYEELVRNNVVKTYKKAPRDLVDQTNQEGAKIANKLELADRIEVMKEGPAFITLKDHKTTFRRKYDARLINPSKTHMGVISKKILDGINHSIVESSKVNQWKSTQEVLHWFKNLENKKKLTFLKLDVKAMYPSISEELVEKALEFAKEYTKITEEDVQIIKHSRKTFLYSNDQVWIKKDTSNPLFDVPMGGTDCAELCELVGTYILNQLSMVVSKAHIGLYRDDMLSALEGDGHKLDHIRKTFQKIFKENGLDVDDIEIAKRVDFLDVTLDLELNSYMPYRKENSEPKYVNVHSNHPRNIIKQIPNMINSRLSTLSSNEEVFKGKIDVYQRTLNHGGYKHNLNFNREERNTFEKMEKKRRRGQTIWFNPPFDLSVKTNIGRGVLKLVDKHFVTANSLHKIFDRNKIKVSYSTMRNIQELIKGSNMKKLNRNQTTKKKCHHKDKSECPVSGKCHYEAVVYKAKVSAQGKMDKFYIGLTEQMFKDRLRAHRKAFNNKALRKDSELSKYIWSLVEEGKEYEISWEILCRTSKYRPGRWYCPLCVAEKHYILMADEHIV